ncbi:MAG TPA: vWA domain-containing protein [Kofleriaceae bacterium]|nr:vWA domain-containing protein [Kofleriaceae bacterium]
MRTLLAPILGIALLALACSTEVNSDDDATGQDDQAGDADDGGDTSDTGDADDVGGGDGSGDQSGDGDGDGGDDACPSVQVSLTDVIPTVMLLIDRSGTMDFDFGSTTRWDAVFDTLMDADQGLVSRLQNQVRFGVALYTSDDGFSNPGGCPIIEEVLPAIGNYQSIFDLYQPLDPIEDTPTAPSIASVQADLAAITEPGPKIIVLATDGEPDTCEVPDPDGLPAARADSVAAAQASHDADINLFVISVGDEVSEEHLQDMANAGIGLPIGGNQNAPFFQALDAQALVDAFDTIVGGVRSCTFALDGEVDESRADEGTVTLDGDPLVFGVDWQLVDSSTLEIVGAACDTLLAGGDHAVAAEFECGVVVD